MLTIEEIVASTGATLAQGKPLTRVKGVSTDSRTLKRGELYIAIKGERFDGHRFIKDVIKKGARGIVVSRRVVVVDKDFPVILVDDTTKALGLIAKYHRSRFHIPVIAVTGSAGKTTAKEMIAEVLKTRCRVLKNIATQNNHIGVPATLLKLNRRHQAVVVELGTNHFGEIRWLTEIANPTIVVLMNIGESHLEFFKNLGGVFREKLDIVKGMTKKGVVVFNKDDRYLRNIVRLKLGHTLVQFGVKNPCDYRAARIMMDTSALRFRVNKGYDVSLNTFAKHNVYNALAAICCGSLLKVSRRNIQKALKDFCFPNGRQKIRVIGGVRVIDDTYNANPVSMRSAIETLESVRNTGRKVIVCGDMLELGMKTAALHRSMGREIAKTSFDYLITVGKYSRLISQEALRKNRNIAGCHCGSLLEVNQKLKTYVKPWDTVLLKGSRGMRMERVIEFLEKNFGS